MVASVGMLTGKTVGLFSDFGARTKTFNFFRDLGNFDGFYGRDFEIL